MAVIEIKITIKEDCLNELKLGFLKAITKPPQYAHLSDIAFFKQWIEDNIINAYKTGKIMIAKEETQPEIIDDIVEVT